MSGLNAAISFAVKLRRQMGMSWYVGTIYLPVWQRHAVQTLLADRRLKLGKSCFITRPLQMEQYVQEDAIAQYARLFAVTWNG